MEQLFGGEGEAVSLVHLGDGVAVGAEFFHRVAVDTGGLTDNHDFIAHFQRFVGLQLHLGDVYLTEVVADESKVDFIFSCLRTIAFTPLTKLSTEVIAIPEAAVEDGSKPLHPMVDFIPRIGTLFDGLHRLSVAFGNSSHIVGTSSAPLNFQHPNASLHNLIEETYGAKVLG